MPSSPIEPPFNTCGVPSTIWNLTCGLPAGHADRYHRKAPGDPHGWRYTSPEVEAEAIREHAAREADWNGY